MHAIQNTLRSSRGATLVVCAARPTCVPTACYSNSRSAAQFQCNSSSRTAFSSVPSVRPSAPRHSTVTAAGVAPGTGSPDGPFKLISRTEVPPFIPRDDMIDQLLRWATYEAGDGGVRNFGMPMKVSPPCYKTGLIGLDAPMSRSLHCPCLLACLLGGRRTILVLSSVCVYVHVYVCMCLCECVCICLAFVRLVAYPVFCVRTTEYS